MRSRTRAWTLLTAAWVAAGWSASPAAALGVLRERPATRLLGVSAETSDGETTIRLRTDGTPGTVDVFVLPGPARLVIDLVGVLEADAPASIPVGGAQVSQLRVGRHPQMIRIVADAGADPPSLERVVSERLPDGLVVKIGLAPQHALGALPSAPPPARPARGADRGPAAQAPLSPQPVAQPSKEPSSGVHVELEAERSRVGRSLPGATHALRSWTKALDLDSSSGGRPVAASDPVFAPDPADRVLPLEWDVGGSGLARLVDAEPRTLAHNRIRLGIFDGRIRLITRLARSRSDAPASQAGGLAPGRGRDFGQRLAPGGTPAEAFSGRLEGTLWEWASTRVDAFGSYQRVDPLFAWRESDRNDSFARSNRRMLEAGGTVRSGPLALTLSRIAEQADVDDPDLDPRPRRRSHRAVLSAALDALRPFHAGASESGLWALAPDSGWISLSQGEIEPGRSGTSGAATRDLSAGLSWSGERSSATLGLWSSRYDGGGTAPDWAGSGADLGSGLYGDGWSLYAGLAAERSLSEQPGYRAVESSLSGFASLALRPEHLPGLDATFYLDRYRAGYGVSAPPLQADSWGFQTGLDLSEYLYPGRSGFRPRLRASYRAIWSRTRGDPTDDLTLDHGPILDLEIDF